MSSFQANYTFAVRFFLPGIAGVAFTLEGAVYRLLRAICNHNYRGDLLLAYLHQVAFSHVAPPETLLLAISQGDKGEKGTTGTP